MPHSSRGRCRIRLGVGMIRLGSIRVATFLTLPASVAFCACAALCQESRVVLSSLPDAPAVQIIAVRPIDVPQHFSAEEGASQIPLQFETLRSVRSAFFGHASFSALYKANPFNEAPQDGNEFRRELTELLRHPPNYHPSSDGSLLRRAASTALGTFLTRTPSGKDKLDTSYLLKVLSSAMIQTAYRPYWNRPASAPFSDFGSRVGNDAGMNLLHEFRPALEQLLKSHTPKFVSRIEVSIEKR